MNLLDLPPRPHILVVALRRLGDVLLATSLIASLRQAFDGAVIDVLVFEGTAGILAGNPDIDRVLTMPSRPGIWQGLVFAARLAKRYDLAVSTQSGDRPTLFALIAGRRHVGPVDGGARGALRRLALWRSVEPQPGSHRLEDMMRLADALGIARVGHLVCPGGVPSTDGLPQPAPLKRFPIRLNRSDRLPAVSSPAKAGDPVLRSAGVTGFPAFAGNDSGELVENVGSIRPESALAREGGEGDYAVIHAAPMFRYKRWTPDGWRAVAAKLLARGVKVVATGGPGPEERAYLDLVWEPLPGVERQDGQLSWPQLARLLSCARLFIGPDTSVTHLAAATGCPTIALFGPTDPRQWGPVPAGGLDPVWDAAGAIQRRKNVWLVQHPLPCLPCQNEGCERHVASFSRCLDELPPARVMEVADAALAMSVAACRD